MNDMITIENTKMQIKEYNGQRIVTFDDICAVHECERKRLTKHFERKRKHFVKDEDYFEMTRRELNDLTSPNSKIIGNPNIKTYLFTESGYLMIVKCLDDDIAWNVQRQLVNAYFRIKEQHAMQQTVNFPECSKQIYQTSSTPVPKNPSWYSRNIRRMNVICEKAGATLSTLCHHILLRLGEEYNLDRANEIYRQEVGHAPRYALDIATYFPELGRLADDYLDRIEEIQNKQ